MKCVCGSWFSGEIRFVWTKLCPDSPNTLDSLFLKSPASGVLLSFKPLGKLSNTPSMATSAILPKDVPRVTETQGIKLFGKWDSESVAYPALFPRDLCADSQNLLAIFRVEVKDISLQDYIQVRHAVFLPHTAGRYAKKQFKKAQMPIVERLVDRCGFGHLTKSSGHP